MKKKSNVALSLYVLVKRNIKLYLKDKMNVFFSVLAPIIVLLLYILFLGELQVNSITSMLESYGLQDALTRSDVSALINNWMISGVMGVSCLTVAVNANSSMVRDRQTGNLNDMLASPIKRWVIYASYIISTFLITFFICMIVLTLSLIYLACTGGFFLSFVDVLAILGITILACICSAFFIVLICGMIKTVSSLSAINGVYSTIIGFLIGAYMPFSMLPSGVQYLGCFVFGTYSTGLFKNYFLRGVLNNMLTKVPADSNIIEVLTENYSLNLDFFGLEISQGWMVFALIFAIVLFGSLILILYYNKKTNFFSTDKRIKKKSKKA